MARRHRRRATTAHPKRARARKPKTPSVDEPKVFISHSAKDLDLIQPFVDFLRLAGDLREGEVFCTSVRGVPNGQFFIETILRALETSELIISLLTPEYFRSQFCIAEVGAAQLRQRAKRNRGDFFSLIVPPIAYEALSGE